MKVDLFEISCELEGISGMITTLSNSFEDGGTRLNDAYMTTTLYSIAKHIDRVIKDVNEIEEKQFEKENIK